MPGSLFKSKGAMKMEISLEVLENNPEWKEAIEEYQCPGCVSGSDTSCYETNYQNNISCEKHCAGTMAMGIGRFFLGMPKGFNRLGSSEHIKLKIYKSYESSDWKYNKFNIPVWKHINNKGHTIVRGMMPRVNEPFLHVFLEDCMDKVDCLEITEEDILGMD